MSDLGTSARIIISESVHYQSWHVSSTVALSSILDLPPGHVESRSSLHHHAEDLKVSV